MWSFGKHCSRPRIFVFRGLAQISGNLKDPTKF